MGSSPTTRSRTLERVLQVIYAASVVSYAIFILVMIRNSKAQQDWHYGMWALLGVPIIFVLSWFYYRERKANGTDKPNE